MTQLDPHNATARARSGINGDNAHIDTTADTILYELQRHGVTIDLSRDNNFPLTRTPGLIYKHDKARGIKALVGVLPAKESIA